jgi:hypothetical protein
VSSRVGLAEIGDVEDEGTAFVVVGAFGPHAESLSDAARPYVVRADGGPDTLDAGCSAFVQDGGRGLRGKPLALVGFADQVADLGSASPVRPRSRPQLPISWARFS